MTEVVHADALAFLKSQTDESVHTIITSPPYYGAIRQYGTNGAHWDAVTYAPMVGVPEITIPEWQGELGAEPDPAAYVGHMIAICREARRVLRSDGVFWLNTADSFAGGGRLIRDHHTATIGVKTASAQSVGRQIPPQGIRAKNLFLVPQRLVLALQADGWIVRADNIWNKKNSLPGSQKDRHTVNHEYVFQLTKSGTYWFDLDAVAEPITESTAARNRRGVSGAHKWSAGAEGQAPHSMHQERENVNGRKQDGTGNRTTTGFNERYFGKDQLPTRTPRTVMTVATAPSAYDFCRCGRLYIGAERKLVREERINPETGKKQIYMLPCLNCGQDDQWVSHYAAFPKNLILPLMLSSCPPIVCAECGTPYQRLTKKNSQSAYQNGSDSHANDGTHNGAPYKDNNPHRMRLTRHDAAVVREQIDFPPTDRPQRLRAEELFRQHGLTQAHLDAIRAVGMADTGKALVTMDGAGNNADETQRLSDEAKQALGGYFREFTFGGRREHLGWQKACQCETDETVAGTVMDFFCGSGTTAMTADEFGRQFVGCDALLDYCLMTEARRARRQDDPQFRPMNYKPKAARELRDDQGETIKQLSVF